MKELKKEAKKVLEKKDAVEKRVDNDAKIDKNKIKRVRQFLQEIEDLTGEYEDCNFAIRNFCEFPNKKDLLEIIDAMKETEKIEEEILDFENDRRKLGYCSGCLRELVNNGKFRKTKCIIYGCKNSRDYKSN